MTNRCEFACFIYYVNLRRFDPQTILAFPPESTWDGVHRLVIQDLYDWVEESGNFNLFDPRATTILGKQINWR